MNRDFECLASAPFDLIVVGGGVFGACAAWDATLRGLRVALLEKDDFGAGASANCFKVAHGGLRYLQHGDLGRVRSSSKDQSALLRIAPHLVQPLPIVVPTYGRGVKGKLFLSTGVSAYHALTMDRAKGINDQSRHIPRGRIMSRTEVLGLFPGLPRARLTGGVLFFDGQIHSPARLVLAFLHEAVSRGATVINYAEVTDYVKDGDRVVGVKAKDRIRGSEIAVAGSLVLNACGGWSDRLNTSILGEEASSRSTFSRDAYFMVEKQFDHGYGLAVSGQTRDPDAMLSRDSRHLFVLPWRERTMVGVWHKVVRTAPEHTALTRQEVASFIGEIEQAYPDFQFSPDDVRHANWGHVPFGENAEGASDLSYGKRSKLIDHKKDHGVEGLLSLIGVRYTVARSDAAEAVTLACQRLGHHASAPRTEDIPLGGATGLDCFNELKNRIRRELPRDMSHRVAEELAHNYGTEYEKVIGSPEEVQLIPGTHTTVGAVRHAIREEMAMSLSDIVFRRTNIGAGGICPAALAAVAGIARQEFGWSEAKTSTEISQAACERALSSDGEDSCKS